MSKVLFVIPTTARRLKLLSNVVQEVLDKNKNHECEFIVVKNGNFPEDVYDEFELQPEVIKERSEPAANIAVAINKGLSYQRDDHDWVVILEDDFLIHKENWIDTYIKVMESKDKCGCIGSRVHGKQSKMTNFKSGDLVLKNCTMLQFFSSKMNNKDTYQMMYNLNAYASMWDYSLGNKTYRYDHCYSLRLGGTPLGECVAFALDFIPAFQKETGVQKINTVFLTDGYGCRLDSVHHVYTDEQVHNVGYDRSLGAPLPSEINDGTKYLQYSNDIIVKDNVTNKSVNSKDFGRDTTKMLLSLLKSLTNIPKIFKFL